MLEPYIVKRLGYSTEQKTASRILGIAYGENELDATGDAKKNWRCLDGQMFKLKPYRDASDKEKELADIEHAEETVYLRGHY